MEILEIKKAIFYPTEIVLLRKKGNITIKKEDIDWIGYRKPTLWNYLWSGFVNDGAYPGYLNIRVGKKYFVQKIIL